MELKKLKRHYFYGDKKLLETYYNKKIGSGIALVKFEEFQDIFFQAQYSFHMGMKDNHKVNSSDGHDELAQKNIRFYYLKYAIQGYNACYDYILQIIYFGCDFFDKEIKSQKDYNYYLQQCRFSESSKFKKEVDKLIGNQNDDFKVFLNNLCVFYESRNDKNHPLADWTNQLKHRGGFIIDEIDIDRAEVKIWNEKTGETIFTSNYINPICVSFQNIEECLVYHNNKIINYVDSLYVDLGFDDPANLKKKFSVHPQRIDTTDCKIELSR